MQQESFHWTKPIMWGGALFSMFFGAGNMIFSLWLGYIVDRSNYWPGVLGFILTAVLFPLIGLLGIWSQQGCVFSFLAPIKSKQAKIAVLIFILSVWGPFGAIPRAVILTFKSLEPFILPMPLEVGHLILFAIVGVFVTSPKKLVQAFGNWLMPALLLAAGGIFAISLAKPSVLTTSELSNMTMALEGMNMGYQTMDGFAAIFFGKLLMEMFAQEGMSRQDYRRFFAITFASALVMLAVVYLMLIEAAARLSEELIVNSPIVLMVEMSKHALGQGFGLIVALLMMGASLSTAIALALIFTDFLHVNVIPTVKRPVIIWSLMAISFVVSLAGIESIMTFSGPLLQLLYPAILCLSIYLIACHRQISSPANDTHIVE